MVKERAFIVSIIILVLTITQGSNVENLLGRIYAATYKPRPYISSEIRCYIATGTEIMGLLDIEGLNREKSYLVNKISIMGGTVPSHDVGFKIRYDYDRVVIVKEEIVPSEIKFETSEETEYGKKYWTLKSVESIVLSPADRIKIWIVFNEKEDQQQVWNPLGRLVYWSSETGEYPGYIDCYNKEILTEEKL
jgi:hypothetical protein